MKKIISITASVLFLMSLTGCSSILNSNTDTSTSENTNINTSADNAITSISESLESAVTKSKSDELKEQYDFYENSIKKIIQVMEVTNEQADDIFIILTSCGMNQDINYIVGSNGNYTVDVGTIGEGITNYYVTINDGIVTEVKEGFDVLYPVSTTETTTISTTEATTNTSASETEVSNTFVTSDIEETTVTVGQKNALKSAKLYLDTMSFSYNGLIEQLEFEGYTNSEAVYAAENCGADWNEQAVKSAKLYLNTMPFSYNGLVEQLEYDGYTNSEALYAADNCGADWNEQAVKSAKSYLDIMPFSKSELIGQLEYDGFTHEQAVYGVEANGL